MCLTSLYHSNSLLKLNICLPMALPTPAITCVPIQNKTTSSLLIFVHSQIACSNRFGVRFRTVSLCKTTISCHCISEHTHLRLKLVTDILSKNLQELRVAHQYLLEWKTEDKYKYYRQELKQAIPVDRRQELLNRIRKLGDTLKHRRFNERSSEATYIIQKLWQIAFDGLSTC